MGGCDACKHKAEANCLGFDCFSAYHGARTVHSDYEPVEVAAAVGAGVLVADDAEPTLIFKKTL